MPANPLRNIGARRWAQNRFQKPSFQVRMPPNSMKGVIFNPEVYISHILSEVYEAAAGRMHNRPAAYVQEAFLKTRGNFSYRLKARVRVTVEALTLAL